MTSHQPKINTDTFRKPTFIDVFAGAGGLSLGLLQAGWKGLFAIEKSPMAFETLKHNLVGHTQGLYLDWPSWLPKEPIDIETFLENYREDIENRLPDIDLMAGGPPCQGFSAAGRRKRDDERNLLFEKYLELVSLIRPKMILLENVRGFATSFTKSEKGGEEIQVEEDIFNADEELTERLTEMGYLPSSKYSVMAKDFGVPQLRPRYILIAIRADLFNEHPRTTTDPFKILYGIRKAFLSRYRLTSEVTLKEAISDLEMRHGFESHREPGAQAFRFGKYGFIHSSYQKLMRRDRQGNLLKANALADSHRFPNHSKKIVTRFTRIIRDFRPGVQLTEEERRQLEVNKHRIAPLAANQVCHTLTSLPDDLIHYREPRVPTVREYARIQSFPDWFEFKSKYTSGGDRRRVEVPRYTQAANAVPPLLAEALGLTLLVIYDLLCLKGSADQRHSLSDISDVCWFIIEPVLRQRDGRGRRTTANLRDVWNGIQYRNINRTRWHETPSNYPHQNVLKYYHKMWKKKQIKLALDTLSVCCLEDVDTQPMSTKHSVNGKSNSKQLDFVEALRELEVVPAVPGGFNTLLAAINTDVHSE